MIWRCDLLAQYKKYKQEIDQAIARVLNSGIYTLGPKLTKFEKNFSAYIGTRFAVGVANGTDALILALKAIDIKPGDEIITTPFTAIPTVSAIVEIGARPVFVDVDEDSFLIDLEKIRNKITPKTKAVIPVHIFGNVVDVSKLRKIVGPKIKIIEDACQAHGSSIGKIKAGAMGDLAAFSFYPTKNIGGYGDGGMITTNNKKLADKIKLLRMYGMTDKDHTVTKGVNSRLDELQAAILGVKLKYVDPMNRVRKSIAQTYIENLTESFRPQKIDKEIFSNYHVFVCRFLGNRLKLVNYLERNGIQTNVYYPMPLYLQKGFKYLGYKKGECPVAESLCKQVIALPMYPEMSSSTQGKIIDTITKSTIPKFK